MFGRCRNIKSLQNTFHCDCFNLLFCVISRKSCQPLFPIIRLKREPIFEPSPDWFSFMLIATLSLSISYCWLLETWLWWTEKKGRNSVPRYVPSYPTLICCWSLHMLAIIARSLCSFPLHPFFTWLPLTRCMRILNVYYYCGTDRVSEPPGKY